jgi:type VI secretion system secreted protein VgrG
MENTMAQLQSRLLNFNLKVNSDSFVAVALDGYEGISQPYCFKVKIICENKIVTESDLLGKEAYVTINKNDQEKHYINGVISTLKRLTHSKVESFHYEVTLQPALATLQLSHNNQVFQNISAPDVVIHVLAENNITNINTDKLIYNHLKIPYCVQYNESSLNFINRILDQNGIFYYFKFEEQKHTLMLCDSSKALDADKGELMFPDATNNKEHLYSLDKYKCLTPRVFALGNTQDKYPSKPIIAELQSKKTITNEQMHYTFSENILSKQEATNKLNNRIDSQTHEKEFCEFTSNYLGLSPGLLFSLADAENKFMITKITQNITDPLDLTGDQQREVKNNFCAVSCDSGFKLEQNIHGDAASPQPAVVVGPDNSTVYTDKFGRVKIQFFWDKEGEYDANSSCWCRVAQTISGNKRGSQWIPRVGDEVLVGFVYGDQNRPIIVGSTYNNKYKEPYALPEKNTITAIKTSPQSNKDNVSQQKSHELIFDDEENNEKIQLNSSGEKTVAINNNFVQNITLDTEKNVNDTVTVDIKTGTGDVAAKEIHLVVGGNSIVIDNSGIKITTT